MKELYKMKRLFITMIFSVFFEDSIYVFFTHITKIFRIPAVEKSDLGSRDYQYEVKIRFPNKGQVRVYIVTHKEVDFSI